RWLVVLLLEGNAPVTFSVNHRPDSTGFYTLPGTLTSDARFRSCFSIDASHSVVGPAEMWASRRLVQAPGESVGNASALSTRIPRGGISTGRPYVASSGATAFCPCTFRMDSPFRTIR